MRVVVRTAESMEAEHLLDITGAHIDSCLYHGQAGLDFAQRLADDGAQVSVPTTLNVSSPTCSTRSFTEATTTRVTERALMNAYEAMGCEPTWTCAPIRWTPGPGSASTSPGPSRTPSSSPTQCSGPAPTATEISSTSQRRSQVEPRRRAPPRHGTPRHDRLRRVGRARNLLDLDVAYPVIGHHIGKLVGSAVPVIVGAPAGLSEDRLKAIEARGIVGLAGHVPRRRLDTRSTRPRNRMRWPSPDRPPHDHRRRSAPPGIDSRPRPMNSARSVWGHPTTRCPNLLG